MPPTPPASPLPWTIEHHGEDGDGIVSANDEYVVEGHPADIAIIVRAVNAHAALTAERDALAHAVRQADASKVEAARLLATALTQRAALVEALRYLAGMIEQGPRSGLAPTWPGFATGLYLAKKALRTAEGKGA